MEEEDDRSHRGQGVEFGGDGKIRPRQGKEPVGKSGEPEPPQQIGADDDAHDQLTQDRGHVDLFHNHPPQPGGKEDDAHLEDQLGHLFRESPLHGAAGKEGHPREKDEKEYER